MTNVETNRAIHKRLQELAGGFEPNLDDEDEMKFFILKTSDGHTWDYYYSSLLPNTIHFPEVIKDIQQLVDARFGEGALEQYLQGDVI